MLAVNISANHGYIRRLVPCWNFTKTYPVHIARLWSEIHGMAVDCKVGRLPSQWPQYFDSTFRMWNPLSGFVPKPNLSISTVLAHVTCLFCISRLVSMARLNPSGQVLCHHVHYVRVKNSCNFKAALCISDEKDFHWLIFFMPKQTN